VPVDFSDPMTDFFLSGNAHVYYGLLVSGGIVTSVLLLGASPLWLIAVLAILAGVFVDLWAHWYAH
jgi:hypothetical protein